MVRDKCQSAVKGQALHRRADTVGKLQEAGRNVRDTKCLIECQTPRG